MTQVQQERRQSELEAQIAELSAQVAALTAQVPAAGVQAERQAAADRSNITPTYGYYRQPNGWITVSPATDTDEIKYRREGWEPLNRYGRFEMASEWAANHPLETLFMKGGAHELSVEQIRNQGLFLDPPLVPTCGQPLQQSHNHHTYICWIGAQQVTFPQLAAHPLAEFPCRFCGAVKPTAAARDQHEGVAHKDEKGDIRTGDTLAAALMQGLAGTPMAPAVPHSTTLLDGRPETLSAAEMQVQQERRQSELEAQNAELSAQIAALLAQVPAAQYDCEPCGKVFASEAGWRQHQYTKGHLRVLSAANEEGEGDA